VRTLPPLGAVVKVTLVVIPSAQNGSFCRVEYCAVARQDSRPFVSSPGFTALGVGISLNDEGFQLKVIVEACWWGVCFEERVERGLALVVEEGAVRDFRIGD
jgi:hypothetical protein